MKEALIEASLQAFTNILDNSHNHQVRNFVETVEIQIGIDPGISRILMEVEFPYNKRPRNKACLLAYKNTPEHEEYELLNNPIKQELHFWDLDDLRDLKRNRKEIKKIVKKYDFFVCPTRELRKIPRLGGSCFHRIKKSPIPIEEDSTVIETFDYCKRYRRVYIKKNHTNINSPIGTVQMNPQELQANISAFMDVVDEHGLLYLVKTVYVKSTMGPSFNLYKRNKSATKNKKNVA
eukprot:TRINITY_DN1797_c0_g2_i2.p1 TRINITY_DN1797_c0_g2~~TRINITY_DN1797_c0_g2_i2.p1  ORF type:complete len:235 (-),score=33.54 TRINITY_DN1797_c0_g2_i2:1-705(-)